MNNSALRLYSKPDKIRLKKSLKSIFLVLLIFASASSAFTQLNILNKHLFPVRVDDKWGYIDVKGEIILELKYEMAMPFSDGYALIQENGELACINSKGEKVLIPKENYSVGKSVVEEMLIYRSNFGESFYAMKEKEYLPPKYKLVDNFSEGLASFKDKITGLYGFINTDGDIQILAQFSACGDFIDGLCPVRYDDNWTYINTEGKMNCLNKYTYAASYSEGIAGVWKGTNYVEYINKENEILFTHQIFKDVNNLPSSFDLPFYSFSDGLLKAIDINSGLYGYMDDEGIMKIRYQFNEAKDFKNGLAAVKYGEKWGYVNKKGEFPIQAQYDYAEDFDHGLAAVYQGGNAEDFQKDKEGVSMAYINKKGIIIWEFAQ